MNVKLSKKLSYTLRHGAQKQGIPIRSDGFVLIRDLIQSKHYPGTTLEDIQQVVISNDKQRFAIKEIEPDVLAIRANQGHSMQQLNVEMELINSPEDIPVAVHGTFSHLLDQILEQGLKPMNRQHIHLSPGLPGSEQVISGIRKNCNVYIFINVKKAMDQGITFYKSSNNVILTSGNSEKVLPPDCFLNVIKL